MMCMELGWTTELGEAFVADQAGVLDAIQRLRTQAIDVGNLQSSPTDEGRDARAGRQGSRRAQARPSPKSCTCRSTIRSRRMRHARRRPRPAPATTTTTTSRRQGPLDGLAGRPPACSPSARASSSTSCSTTTMMTGQHDYYYPNYGYGGMPYYPPYPYRPAYGGGYYPSNGYNRPPSYNSGFAEQRQRHHQHGRQRPGGSYWDRYDNNGPAARPTQRHGEQPDHGGAPESPGAATSSTSASRARCRPT